MTLFFLLSDSTSQFLQHSQTFFIILRLAQPEGVLVFHDVGQHRSAEEHQVFAPGRVLDADLKLLHKRRTKRGVGIETQCSDVHTSLPLDISCNNHHNYLVKGHIS